MIIKKQYYSDKERDIILIENCRNQLIEEQNISEGNFLIFDDNPKIIVLKSEYENLENQLLLVTESSIGGIL